MTTMWMELGSQPSDDLSSTLENYTCVANHAGNITRHLSGCGVCNFLVIARTLHVLQREQNEGSGDLAAHANVLLFAGF